MVIDRGDVVVAPFRFTEADIFKVRPVLILSNNDYTTETGHCIVAMITSAARSSWAADINLESWRQTGLRKPCVIRMKIATVASSRISAKVGKVDAQTVDIVMSKVAQLFI
jgi:mRNA interferase MazF